MDILDTNNETYESWLCDISFLPCDVLFCDITYNGKEGMKLYLTRSGNPMNQKDIKISFLELPIAITVTNEIQRLQSANKLPDCIKSAIFVVKNSNFINWLNSDSLNIYNKCPWIHFCIITQDEWIDIIDVNYPIVTEK